MTGREFKVILTCCYCYFNASWLSLIELSQSIGLGHDLNMTDHQTPPIKHRSLRTYGENTSMILRRKQTNCQQDQAATPEHSRTMPQI